MDYKLSKSSNNLRVLTVPMPSLESACVTLWVEAGSRYETKDKAGVSHFLEHMAFKGGKRFKTALEVSEALDNLGAEYNAATSREWTCFYVKTRVAQIEKAFDILSDMLVTPTLKSEDIERERGVILEEIAMDEDQPSEKVGSIFSQLIFANHPLGEDIAGTPDSVKNIKKEDFLGYRSLYYVTENCLLTVSGGIEEKQTLSLTDKYFGNLPKGSESKPSPFVDGQDSMRKKHLKKKTEQTHLIIGFPAYSIGDPRSYAQNLLSIIMGGGMSSRLFTEIREKRGLAYSVGTSVSTHIDTGLFATYAGVDPKNADEVAKIIINEHEAIKSRKKVTKVELQKAKDYIKGRGALSLEDTFAVNSFFAKREMLTGQVETPQQYFNKIDKVTLDDLEAVANELFKKNRLNIASIGPEEVLIKQ